MSIGHLMGKDIGYILIIDVLQIIATSKVTGSSVFFSYFIVNGLYEQVTRMMGG
jgi:hypothetical protein